MRRSTPRLAIPAVPLAAFLVLVMMLTGCTEQSTVGTRQPSMPTPQGQSGASGATQEQLATQKKAAGIADCPAADPAVAPVDHGLPDVTLTCLGGGRDVRLAGLRGRPMLISVWAQWCGPCRTEAPFLSDVAKHNTSDLMFLGVDYVDGVMPDKAIAFAQAAGWKYPQLADTDKVLAAPLQILGPPYTFLVRADGTIAYKQSGPFRSAEQIRTLVHQHLGVAL